MAMDQELDLVEVNPKADPPVCKIMDFGRFKYEEKKKVNEAKKKQSVVEVKEVKVRPKTDDHDIETKVRHIRRFLDEGNKAKITVRFRGREMTHPEKGREVLDEIIKLLEGTVVIEAHPQMDGKTMTMLVAPKPGAIKKPATVATPGTPGTSTPGAPATTNA